MGTCNQEHGVFIFRPYKVSSILPAEIGSKAEVGSSKRMILGLVAKTRATQTRCCCPPEAR